MKEKAVDLALGNGNGFACVNVCVNSMCMASWHGKYEKCQAGLSSTGRVN